MKYICKINNEKVGEVTENNEELALRKAILLFGMEVDIERKK